jgi:hypothetical protein
MARETETFASRRADYDNFTQRSQWIAGGVAVVLVVVATLFGHGSDALATATLTSASLAGACAGFARVEFAWAASQIELKPLETDAEPEASLPTDSPSWPKRTEIVMISGLFLLAVAGALLLAFVWQIAS